MKIRILGTAAAEGWPGIFCACDICKQARCLGGKDIRSRASVMVNDDIKVDFNADSYHHLVKHSLDFSQLRHIVFTHSHNDHLNPGELQYMGKPFCHGRREGVIQTWSSRDVEDILLKHYPDPATIGMHTNWVAPFTTVKLDEIEATPIIAVHKQDELCYNWIFSQDGRSVLYASDTGFYQEVTWEYLSTVKLNLVICECTFGFNTGTATHMSIDSVRKMREQLARMATITSDTPFVITHFSHNVAMLHQQIEDAVADEGLIVAYDGILLEV